MNQQTETQPLIEAFTDDLDRLAMTAGQAAALLPGRPHVNTVRRWMTRGKSRGAKLESLRVGKERMTSRAALREFFRRDSDNTAAPNVRTTRQRDRAHAAAMAEIEAN